MSPTVVSKDRRITFSLGAIVSVVFFVAGCGITWGTMRADLKVVAEHNAAQDKTISEHAAKMERLGGIYERLAGVEAKLDLLVKRLP